MLPPQRLHKVALRTHQVEVDAVVHQIVRSWRRVARCAEVYPVRLAHGLDLVVRPRQANELGVELGQVFLHLGGAVARRVARHKHGLERVGALFIHKVVHDGHLVELFGADVGTVREAEVYLVEGRAVCQLWSTES